MFFFSFCLSSRLNKMNSTEEKHDHREAEKFVVCSICTRKNHQICAMCSNSKQYKCAKCLQMRDERKYSTNALPRTKLSSHIETRVRDFLKTQNSDCIVNIRVVCSSDTNFMMMPEMQQIFENSHNFKHRAKTVLAFFGEPGTECCFFAMFVQEYGSDCPSPNKNSVYISYLDSVNLFNPKQYRTSIYQEILLGYIDYIKLQGYSSVHLWACPPLRGVDYIFYCHPESQKTPSQYRLEQWYHVLFKKGVAERIIENYKNIDASEFKTVNEFPYFSGDFWPYYFEDVIKSIKTKVGLDIVTDAAAKVRFFLSKYVLHILIYLSPGCHTTRRWKKSTKRNQEIRESIFRSSVKFTASKFCKLNSI